MDDIKVDFDELFFNQTDVEEERVGKY